MPTQFKYNIRRMLYRMPGRPQTNELKLAIAVDRHLRTIQTWLTLEADDKANIDVASMYKMAEFFGCTIDELMNNPVKEVAK